MSCELNISMLRFTSETLNKYLLFGSTLCCSVIVVPIINFWFSGFDPIETSDLVVNESIWLRSWIIPVSVLCFTLMFFLFSRRKGDFVVISVIGFVLSLSAVLTVAQLFTRFIKPLEYSKFWPFLGVSLLIGILVSLGTMSTLSVARWRLIRFVSARSSLP